MKDLVLESDLGSRKTSTPATVGPARGFVPSGRSDTRLEAFTSASAAIPPLGQAKPITKAAAPKGVYTYGGKRLFDIVLAILILPILAPVIAICWAIVRLDGGPGFYSQSRVGLNGKTFRCWKLRSMVVDAEAVLQKLCAEDPDVAREWEVNQKLDDDPRITKIGKFIRSTSLDELPQLWNVIVGDMSFVGPRPFMVNQKVLYDEAGGGAYYEMRPGITGHWQVYGRGETSFADRVGFDNNYYRALSLIEDIRLIFKTALVVLNRTGK